MRILTSISMLAIVCNGCQFRRGVAGHDGEGAYLAPLVDAANLGLAFVVAGVVLLARVLLLLTGSVSQGSALQRSSTHNLAARGSNVLFGLRRGDLDDVEENLARDGVEAEAGHLVVNRELRELENVAIDGD